LTWKKAEDARANFRRDADPRILDVDRDLGCPAMHAHHDLRAG
jgi:hypothetical protein